MTLALIEEACQYLKHSSHFGDLRSTTILTENAPNNASSLFARSLQRLQLSSGIPISVLQRNEPGDRKTLLGAFFGLFYMSLSRWLESNFNNVVSPYQEASAVASSIPGSAL